ncbi:MAG: hypothetical protein H6581_07660 [Bacteroidia bacterium]|nr:hypothetical protein [Bacteroidia bacterium]
MNARNMAANTPAKILILRLSSIGDIVLTTPVIRSLRKCFPEAEIHFLTKSVFHDILKFNPYLDKIHLFDKQKGLDATLSELRQEEFEVILDLHHNLRTLRIGMGLDIPRHTFPKLNTEKFLLTN